jgi:hypothetical protein
MEKIITAYFLGWDAQTNRHWSPSFGWVEVTGPSAAMFHQSVIPVVRLRYREEP